MRVDGKPLAARERTRLFLFHKPRGLVTTARDPEGRPTIFDALPPDLPRLVAVGRLDINTEGLILLTNDGGLARVLELPATGWLRRYRVRAHGRIDQAKLDALARRRDPRRVDYAGIEARLDREQGSNAWITMGLREGKNREIKKVLEHLGLAVNRLIRVSFGPFELGDLAEGEVAEVRTRVLRDQLGAKLAREAGVDFDAPIVERAAPRRAEPREERRGRREAPGPRADAARARPRRGARAAVRKGRCAARRAAALRARAPPQARLGAAGGDRRRRGGPAQAGRAQRHPRPQGADDRGRTPFARRRGGAQARRRKSRAAAQGRRAGAGERRGRRFEPKRETAERPRRPDSFEVKRARDGEGRERPPRAEREEPRSRAPSSSRAARAAGGRTAARASADSTGRTPSAKSQRPAARRTRSRRAARRRRRRASAKVDRAQARPAQASAAARTAGRASPGSPGRAGRPPGKGPRRDPAAGRAGRRESPERCGSSAAG